MFEESASAEASTSSCETATFNRRPFSHHMSPVSLTIAGAGILNLLSIDYASRPRLRSRLTLGGRTLPRKPWFYGGQEFNLACRYSCLHPHLLELHLAFPHGFNAPTMLSYHAFRANPGASRASVYRLSPIIFGARSLDESAITHCLNGGCL